MNKPKYEIGDRIPGTKGKVVSKTYSYQGKWVYCIAFDNGFSTITFLTIAEDDIDISVIKVLKQQK